MGLINEKDSPEEILKMLIQNQNSIPLNDSFGNSFKLIHKIINYYEDLNSLLKNDKEKNKNNISKDKTLNSFSIFDKEVDKTKINRQLERIKKWINMLRTKNINEKEEDRRNSTLKSNSENCNPFLSQNFNNKHFLHSQSINNTSSKKNYLKKKSNVNKHKPMYSDDFKLKSQISDFSDSKIEKGIKNFYTKNNDKFLERVTKGPPECFRLTSWIILNKIPLSRSEKVYNYYLEKELNDEIKSYIIKDIQRSFHDKEDSDKLKPKEIFLYNVLKAFSNLDSELGYCQGMNILASFLLNASDFNETETFYLLISMFSSTFIQRNIKQNFNLSIRGIYNDGFPLLLFMNYIFDIEFSKMLSELKKKFEELSITYDVWIGKWFQTLFTIVLPNKWCKRLFDCIFVYGIFFQVQFGLAFISLLEKKLLKFDDETIILDYFKNFRTNILQNEKNILEQININELINKSEKIKLDIKDYYNKYIEEYPAFENEIKKNNVEYNLIEIDDLINNQFNIQNDLDINDSSNKTPKDLSSNDSFSNKKISNFTLTEETKKSLFSKNKKKSSILSLSGNYDNDIDEKNSIDDFGELRIFPESKNLMFQSCAFEKIRLELNDENEKENTNYNSSHKKTFMKMKSLNTKLINRLQFDDEN